MYKCKHSWLVHTNYVYMYLNPPVYPNRPLSIIITGDYRVRACNYVKIETGQNFSPILKIVTRTAQAA